MFEFLKNIGKHSLVYGIGTLLSRSLGFLLIPLYTHHLTTSEYGIISLLDFTIAIVATIIGLNMSQAAMRFYYDSPANDDSYPKLVISTSLLLVFPLLATGCTALGLSATQISVLVFDRPDLSDYFRIMFITLFFEGLLTVPFAYLRILEKSLVFASINFSKTLLGFSLNIYFIAFLKLGVLGILYSNLITNALICIALVIWVFTKTGFRVSVPLAKRIVKFSLPLAPAGIATICLHSADRYILNILAGTSQVGLYDLGYKFGAMLSNAILVPFSLIWGAVMYKVVNRKDGKHTVITVLTYFSFVSIYAALILSVFIGDILSVMAAPAYQEAHTVVPFVLLGYVFFGIATILHLGILVKKQTQYTLIVALIAAGSNIAMNFLLIPLFAGSMRFVGAGVSTALSFLMLAFGRYYFANKLYPIPYEFGRILNLLLTAALILLVCRLTGFESLWGNFSFRVVLVLAYPVLLYFTGFYDARELGKIKSLVHDRIALFRVS